MLFRSRLTYGKMHQILLSKWKNNHILVYDLWNYLNLISYKLLLECYSILFEHIHFVKPIWNLLLIVRVHGYHWPQKYKIYPKCLSTNIPYSPSLFIIKHVLENWNSAEEEPIYTYTPSCHVTGWFELRFLLLWYILIYFVFILWS